MLCWKWQKLVQSVPLLKKYLVKFTSESCAKISSRFNWSIVIEQPIKTISSFKLVAISFSSVFILYYSVNIVRDVTALCFSSFLSKTREVWIKIKYRLSFKRHWSSCRKTQKLLAVSFAITKRNRFHVLSFISHAYNRKCNLLMTSIDSTRQNLVVILKKLNLLYLPWKGVSEFRWTIENKGNLKYSFARADC